MLGSKVQILLRFGFVNSGDISYKIKSLAVCSRFLLLMVLVLMLMELLLKHSFLQHML